MTVMIDKLDDYADWTVLNDDAEGLDFSTFHNLASTSLCFDKANGTANTKYAIVYKTISPISLGRPNVHLQDKLYWCCRFSALTDISDTVIRLGTDASNYIEYRYPDTSLTAAKWVLCSSAIGAGFATGAGANLEDIRWIGVGAKFDDESNTLTHLKFNYLYINEVDG